MFSLLNINFFNIFSPISHFFPISFNTPKCTLWFRKHLHCCSVVIWLSGTNKRLLQTKRLEGDPGEQNNSRIIKHLGNWPFLDSHKHFALYFSEPQDNTNYQGCACDPGAFELDLLEPTKPFLENLFQLYQCRISLSLHAEKGVPHNETQK